MALVNQAVQCGPPHGIIFVDDDSIYQVCDLIPGFLQTYGKQPPAFLVGNKVDYLFHQGVDYNFDRSFTRYSIAHFAHENDIAWIETPAMNVFNVQTALTAILIHIFAQ
jgi:hypothetical protein